MDCFSKCDQIRSLVWNIVQLQLNYITNKNKMCEHFKVKKQVQE